MKTKSQIFIKGLLDVLPLLIPVFPFGVIYGVIGMELGLGPYLTFASSFVIFAGSSQLVFAQLLTAGASPLVMISSVAVINARHLLYGAVLSEYLNKLSIFWKLILSYFMTDQAFATSSKFLKSNQKSGISHYHLLGSGFTLWFIWQASTLLGIFLGAIVPEQLGLTFAVPLTFLSLIVSDLKKIDHLMVVLSSGLVATFFYNVPLKSYVLLAAFVGMSVAYFFTLRIIKENK